MVLLQSAASDIGMLCPEFSLVSVDDKHYTLADFSSSKALLIAFICNHCPYVRAIEDRLIDLRKAFSHDEFAMVGICSNDAQKYPDDSKDELKKRWVAKSYGFPYLIDEDQALAKAMGAVCTPDLFLFDHARRLFYHGQLDDNWRDQSQVTSRELYFAIKAAISGKEPPTVQRPSMGCSIKWK